MNIFILFLLKFFLKEMEAFDKSFDCISKIILKLKNYNYNFDKKVKIFDYEKNKVIEVNINYYIWYFIQSIDNLNMFGIRYSDYVYLYIQENIKENWVKNIKLDSLQLNFSKNNPYIIEMNTVSNSYERITPSIFKKEHYSEIYSLDIFSEQILYYSTSILNKLYNNENNEKTKIATSFLRVGIDESNYHSCILIIYKDNEEILNLFLYDPNGAINFHYRKTISFLLVLKTILTLKNNYYFKNVEIINQELFPYLELQNLTEAGTDIGYCLSYSSFFLYCFITLCNYFSQSKNIKSILLLLNYSFAKIIKQNKNNIYFIIVSFANQIKDTFIKKTKKENYTIVYDNILKTVDKYIIFFFDEFKKEYNILELDNEKDKINNEEYVEKKYEKRNYEQELKFLDWNKIKEKGENEDCIINEDCISKLCVKNKCTKPNDNDKLDFLTKLEWKEIKEEKCEIEKIIHFCKNKTLKNFEELNDDTKDFFNIAITYMLKSDDIKRIRDANNFSIYLDLNRKIVDYEEKYLILEDFLNNKENIFRHN